jgi:flagellin-like hook-associated protein FlgL
MTSDIVLTAALRNNLLSLQDTQNNINATQYRLSTGKKVNSALDNPQSFFAAQTLNNRAADLNKLLDSIGQSIEVIKAADNGVTALTNLVNQAQALAQTAQTAVTTGSTQASATGTTSLSGSTLLNTLNGFSSSGNDQIAISVTDPAAGTLAVDGTVALGTAKGGLITIANNWTVQDLIDNINDINSRAGTGGNAPLATAAISASLDSSGHLSFAATNGGTLHVQFISNNATTSKASVGQSIANSLGFNGIAKINLNGAGAVGSTDTVDFTARASAAITSNKLYVNATGTLAQTSTLLTQLEDSAGNSLIGNGATTNLNAADTLILKVGGKTSADLLHYTSTGGQSYSATTSTIGSLVDAINHDSTINSLVTATFDTTTGQISISAKDASATDVQFQFTAATANDSFSKATALYASGLGFGTQALTTAGESKAQETVRFGAASGQLASLQTQYDSVLGQIDALVSNGDTGYQGTNLLNGDNLLTTFNENRTSTLTTTGVTFTSGGLELTSANFGNVSNVTQALTQLDTALSTVRDFGSTLATNLSVIQTRQTFTNSLINTLQEGAGNLVNADQNEEGATLLALQTRQSLGVTALSLASQSNQSILRLFQ